MTDEILAWQTDRLQRIATERGERVVKVRPELVVEIAFNGIQKSPRYPGGLALRFARLKGYREDKSAEEADTIDRVREIYRKRTGTSLENRETQLNLFSSGTPEHPKRERPLPEAPDTPSRRGGGAPRH
jgi:hypothetical protein